MAQLGRRWFRDLTDKNLGRGVFASVPDLTASIRTCLNWPYVWTATAESILARIARAQITLDQVDSKNCAGPLASDPARTGLPGLPCRADNIGQTQTCLETHLVSDSIGVGDQLGRIASTALVDDRGGVQP